MPLRSRKELLADMTAESIAAFESALRLTIWLPPLMSIHRRSKQETIARNWFFEQFCPQRKEGLAANSAEAEQEVASSEFEQKMAKAVEALDRLYYAGEAVFEGRLEDWISEPLAARVKKILKYLSCASDHKSARRRFVSMLGEINSDVRGAIRELEGDRVIADVREQVLPLVACIGDAVTFLIGINQ